MSWISDLADKAENILNKIDQNAATVLNSTTPTRRGIDEYLLTNEPVIEDNVSTTLPHKKGLILSPSKKLRVVESKINVQYHNINDHPITEDLNSEANVDSTSEKELAAFKIALTEIRAERDDLKKIVCLLEEELKIAKGEIKIKELEELVQVLTTEKNETNAKLCDISTMNNEYLKTISELESTLAKKRQDLFDIKEKLNNQTKETEQKTVDLEHYRKRAQSTLQTKDKIIEELRQGNISRIENLDSDQNKIQQIELENLKHDNVIKSNQILELRQEMDESCNAIENLQKELQNKEMELESIRNVLMNNLKIEQEKSLNLEAEMKLLNHEISAIRQETNRQRKLHIAQLHEKEHQLNKLRKGNADYQAVGDSHNVEARLQSLTQALFQKQTSLESITSEKNALKIQLEKVEDQLRHVINQSRLSSAQLIHVNDTDDAKAQFPIIMRENPFDTRVTRRVKRAYSSLDSAGIRIGVFLRRYPLIRIAVLIYIALVHLWVIFVLFSSTPS